MRVKLNLLKKAEKNYYDKLKVYLKKRRLIEYGEKVTPEKMYKKFMADILDMMSVCADKNVKNVECPVCGELLDLKVRDFCGCGHDLTNMKKIVIRHRYALNGYHTKGTRANFGEYIT